MVISKYLRPLAEENQAPCRELQRLLRHAPADAAAGGEGRMDIIIKGGPEWPSLLVALLVGFGGAAIGAASIFSVEMWRQVLAFKGALRVVKYELHENALNLGIAAKKPEHANLVGLRDDGWTGSRQSLALLLPEGSWRALARDYASVAWARMILSGTPALDKNEIDEAVTTIKEIEASMAANAKLLIKYEARPRFGLFWDALRGRPVTPESLGNARVGPKLPGNAQPSNSGIEP